MIAKSTTRNPQTDILSSLYPRTHKQLKKISKYIKNISLLIEEVIHFLIPDTFRVLKDISKGFLG